MKQNSFLKKFKTFVKETNTIHYWNVYEDFKKIYKQLEQNSTESIPKLSENFLQNIELNITPQQFTGFYDKNNDEIYEGDYIKLNNNIDCIVEFTKGSFILKDLNSKKKIWFHNIKKTDILENMGVFLTN
jgi:hypothetical protein